MSEAQALAHAERVLADPPPGRGFVEADQLQHLVDALDRHAHGAGGDGKRLVAASSRVLGRGVKKDADTPSRVRQVAVPAAEYPSIAAAGFGKPDEHPHRGRLA